MTPVCRDPNPIGTLLRVIVHPRKDRLKQSDPRVEGEAVARARDAEPEILNYNNNEILSLSQD